MNKPSHSNKITNHQLSKKVLSLWIYQLLRQPLKTDLINYAIKKIKNLSISINCLRKIKSMNKTMKNKKWKLKHCLKSKLMKYSLWRKIFGKVTMRLKAFLTSPTLPQELKKNLGVCCTIDMKVDHLTRKIVRWWNACLKVIWERKESIIKSLLKNRKEKKNSRLSIKGIRDKMFKKNKKVVMRTKMSKTNTMVNKRANSHKMSNSITRMKIIVLKIQIRIKNNKNNMKSTIRSANSRKIYRRICSQINLKLKVLMKSLRKLPKKSISSKNSTMSPLLTNINMLSPRKYWMKVHTKNKVVLLMKSMSST